MKSDELAVIARYMAAPCREKLNQMPLKQKHTGKLTRLTPLALSALLRKQPDISRQHILSTLSLTEQIPAPAIVKSIMTPS